MQSGRQGKVELKINQTRFRELARREQFEVKWAGQLEHSKTHCNRYCC